MSEKGWLKEQFDETEKQIKMWPDWMRREAGIVNLKDGAQDHSEIKAKAQDPIERRAMGTQGAGSK